MSRNGIIMSLKLILMQKNAFMMKYDDFTILIFTFLKISVKMLNLLIEKLLHIVVSECMIFDKRLHLQK